MKRSITKASHYNLRHTALSTHQALLSKKCTSNCYISIPKYIVRTRRHFGRRTSLLAFLLLFSHQSREKDFVVWQDVLNIYFCLLWCHDANPILYEFLLFAYCGQLLKHLRFFQGIGHFTSPRHESRSSSLATHNKEQAKSVAQSFFFTARDWAISNASSLLTGRLRLKIWKE